jgi:hypothetical protein
LYPDVVLGQGLIARLALEADYDGPLSHPLEDAVKIEELFKSRGVFND